MKKLISIVIALILTVCPLASLANTDAPEIIQNPTLGAPQFVVSNSDSVEKYEWVATIQTEIPVNDQNADSLCTNCEGKYNSEYDAETNLWTGAKMCDAENGVEMFYFAIELEAEERLYINAGPEALSVRLFDYEKTQGFTPGFSLVGNVFVFDADISGKYAVMAVVPNEDVTISAFKIKIDTDVLIEGETESTLGKLEIGYIYKCVAYYDDDTYITSKSFYAFPKAITEPTADNPTFKVGFEEEANYQWYEIDENEISTPVTGETSATLSKLEDGKSYYCLASFPFGMNVESDIISLSTDGVIPLLGDVNGDGVINQYDYILVKRHYFGTRILTDAEMLPADVNEDTLVDQYDYILICRHYFGTYTIG